MCDPCYFSLPSVFFFCSKSERSFSVVSINAIVFPLIDLWSSLAAGVGWGAAQSFVFYASMLGHSLGPGALYTPQCSLNSFILASITGGLFNALHILLMILA